MVKSEILQMAMDIARAQVSVRPMSATEVASYISELTEALDACLHPGEKPRTASPAAAAAPKNSIGENYVTCLECGKKFKVISSRHLMTHGLTAETYKEKWGIKKGTSLAAKSLVRLRRRKMQDMRLWERRVRNH